MNILLLYPPDNPELLVKYAFEPLGLEIIAATVPGDEVQIMDMRMESYDSLTQTLIDFDPGLIGLSVNNTIYVNEVRKLLDHIRKVKPRASVIVGGQHVSAVPEDFFDKRVDAIFMGWADKSFPAYVEALRSGNGAEDIPGIILVENGSPIRSNDNFYPVSAEEIPFPRRDLIQKYWKNYKNEVRTRTALVNTARGCPFKCTFCSVWKSVGGEFFVRSAEDVFEELKSLPSDVKFVFFADDNTFVNVKRANKLAELIENSDLDLQYSGYCRSDTIVRSPEMIKRWTNIGLINLCVGFEAVDNDQLKKLNKSNYTDKNRKAAEFLHEIGQHFRPHFLIDPDFEETDFEKISNYVNRLELASPVFTMLTPLPGTDFYEENKSRIHKSYDFFDFAHWVYPTKMEAGKFLSCYSGLYHEAYSLRRHSKIFAKKWLYKLIGKKSGKNHFMHIPLWKVMMFKIVSMNWERKLRKQYSINGEAKPVQSPKRILEAEEVLD